jgi:hypothetical protein
MARLRHQRVESDRKSLRQFDTLEHLFDLLRRVAALRNRLRRGIVGGERRRVSRGGKRNREREQSRAAKHAEIRKRHELCEDMWRERKRTRLRHYVSDELIAAYENRHLQHQQHQQASAEPPRLAE